MDSLHNVAGASMEIDSEPFDKEVENSRQLARQVSERSSTSRRPTIAVAEQGDLYAAIEKLLALEKANRVMEDVPKTRTCCLAILELCFEAKQWKLLNEQITVLAKRRGQLKQVSNPQKLSRRVRNS